MHLSIVSATTNLLTELDAFFRNSSYPKILKLLDPNASSIAYKRKAIRGPIRTLESHDGYFDACERIFNA